MEIYFHQKDVEAFIEEEKQWKGYVNHIFRRERLNNMCEKVKKILLDNDIDLFCQVPKEIYELFSSDDDESVDEEEYINEDEYINEYDDTECVLISEDENNNEDCLLENQFSVKTNKNTSSIEIEPNLSKENTVLVIDEIIPSGNTVVSELIPNNCINEKNSPQSLSSEFETLTITNNDHTSSISNCVVETPGNLVAETISVNIEIDSNLNSLDNNEFVGADALVSWLSSSTNQVPDANINDESLETEFIDFDFILENDCNNNNSGKTVNDFEVFLIGENGENIDAGIVNEISNTNANNTKQTHQPMIYMDLVTDECNQQQKPNENVLVGDNNNNVNTTKEVCSDITIAVKNKPARIKSRRKSIYNFSPLKDDSFKNKLASTNTIQKVDENQIPFTDTETKLKTPGDRTVKNKPKKIKKRRQSTDGFEPLSNEIKSEKNAKSVVKNKPAKIKFRRESILTKKIREDKKVIARSDDDIKKQNVNSIEVTNEPSKIKTRRQTFASDPQSLKSPLKPVKNKKKTEKLNEDRIVVASYNDTNKTAKITIRRNTCESLTTIIDKKIKTASETEKLTANNSIEEKQKNQLKMAEKVDSIKRKNCQGFGDVLQNIDGIIQSKSKPLIKKKNNISQGHQDKESAEENAIDVQRNNIKKYRIPKLSATVENDQKIDNEQTILEKRQNCDQNLKIEQNKLKSTSSQNINKETSCDNTSKMDIDGQESTEGNFVINTQRDKIKNYKIPKISAAVKNNQIINNDKKTILKKRSHCDDDNQSIHNEKRMKSSSTQTINSEASHICSNNSSKMDTDGHESAAEISINAQRNKIRNYKISKISATWKNDQINNNVDKQTILEKRPHCDDNTQTVGNKRQKTTSTQTINKETSSDFVNNASKMDNDGYIKKKPSRWRRQSTQERIPCLLEIPANNLMQQPKKSTQTTNYQNRNDQRNQIYIQQAQVPQQQQFIPWEQWQQLQFNDFMQFRQWQQQQTQWQQQQMQWQQQNNQWQQSNYNSYFSNNMMQQNQQYYNSQYTNINQTAPPNNFYKQN